MNKPTPDLEYLESAMAVLLRKWDIQPGRLRDITGCSNGTAYNWWNGTTSPFPRELPRIADATQIPLKDLLEALKKDRIARRTRARVSVSHATSRNKGGAR